MSNAFVGLMNKAPVSKLLHNPINISLVNFGSEELLDFIFFFKIPIETERRDYHY